MKVIAGLAKGRRLKSLRGLLVRPTPAILREAIFNIIGDSICGSSFLDLFAGTGGVGIEAISRGASFVLFVEKEGRACSAIKENLRLCGFQSGYQIICRDAKLALRYIVKKSMSFDIAFLDPPYGTDLAHQTMAQPELARALKLESLILVQHSLKKSLENKYGEFALVIVKKFGDTALSVYSRADCLRAAN